MAYLIHSGKEKSGGDLVAITIQRSREHGIPSYNQFREYCGMKKADTFDELTTEFVQNVCLAFFIIREMV